MAYRMTSAQRTNARQDKIWENYYRLEAEKQFKKAEKDWANGLTIKQISKKRGLGTEYLQRRLIYKEN